MKRSILKSLELWKNASSRKPLVLRGARQVGKTYSLTEFGRKSFAEVLHADFEKEKSLRRIFEGDLKIGDILLQLEIAFHKKIIPGKSLLILDEIQACPRALAALRYFYEDFPQLHVVAAGSLLEFEMDNVSFPVGRVEFARMFPMTFEEFLQEENPDLLLQRPGLNRREMLPDFLHRKFLEAAGLYFIVGGMPEAVRSWFSTRSFQEVTRVQDNLFQSLVRDLPKYERKLDIEFTQELLEKIPRHVGNKMKYSTLMPQAPLYGIKKTLKVLERALLIHKVTSSHAVGLPLGEGVNPKAFKYLFLDIGLMQHACGIYANDVLQSPDLMGVFEGALCEQFVGQELLACGGSQHGALYYWSREQKSSQAEVDYLLLRGGEIYPLEIKSGPAGRLKSLHFFLKEHPKVRTAYVLNSGNVGESDAIRFLPFYADLKGADAL